MQTEKISQGQDKMDCVLSGYNIKQDSFILLQNYFPSYIIGYILQFC